MAKREIRLGGGLNYRYSEDAIEDLQLLRASSVVFTEPGALTVEVPPYSIQEALLSATLTSDRNDFVQGIADAYLNSNHFLFIKNDHCWQRTDYDGATPTAIGIGSITATVLASGANAIVFTGAVAYYQAPSAGTLVLKLWGAGGGGGTGSGLGASNGGGAGAYATTTLTVTAGDVITVYVGAGGQGGHHDDSLASGGWPDGGDAAIYSGTGATTGYQAGGGGGSSRVYLNGTLCIVAGGGGGARLEGGSGGGTTGRDDANGGGTGGTQSAGGVDNSDPSNTDKWGASFQGGSGGTNSTADAGGGGGGGYYGGGGGGGANFGSVRGGGGGSGYLGGLGTSESMTVNNVGTQSPAPGSGESEYDAAAGRVTGNPDSDTGTGGYRDATSSSNDGNGGGNGYIVATFTAGGQGSDNGQSSPGNHQLSALRYNDWVYIADGYTFRRYGYLNGAYVCQRVGVQRPTAPGYTAESGSGGSVAGITYKWGVTFWNGVAESNMSPLLEHTAIASGKQIELTIPTDTQILSGTLYRRLYRSNENGDAMFFVAEITNNTATTYTDPMGVSSLAGDPYAAMSDPAETTIMPGVTAVQTVGTMPYQRPSGAVHNRDAELRGEIWYSNLGALADWRNHDQPTTDTEGTIRNLRLLEDVVYGIVENTKLAFSLLGNAEYWFPYNQVIVGRNTGETLQDIQTWDKDVICYTDRAVYRFRRFGVDATDSTIEKIADIGCCSEMGVAVTDNQGHIFMSWDGVYQFDGRIVRKISFEIDDIWRDSANTDYVQPDLKASVCAGAKNDKVWFGYRHTATGAYPTGYYNDRLLFLDMTDGSVKWATAPWNETSLHRGYDGTMFAGNELDYLQILDHTTITNVNASVAFRTKLFPLGSNVKNQVSPEKIFIDADLAGQDIGVIVYGDSYDNAICTWTITAANERRVYTKCVPAGKWKRIGIAVTMALGLATRQPKFYTIGVMDNGPEAEI